jgi:hypothetical protein
VLVTPQTAIEWLCLPAGEQKWKRAFSFDSGFSFNSGHATIREGFDHLRCLRIFSTLFLAAKLDFCPFGLLMQPASRQPGPSGGWGV